MRLSKEATEEIRRLGNIVCDCQQELKEAERALGKFVREYMTVHNLWESPEDVMEVIRHLPQGYFRFTMYEKYYELQEAQDNSKIEQSMKQPGL